MTKKHHIYKILSTFILPIFILIMVFPFEVSAQRYSFEGQNTWTERDHWRTYSSSFSSKVNNLGSERVLDLPVPILFGVTPANLTPNFGDPRANGRTHEGEDILAPRGAPVVTPTQAVVIHTGVGETSGNYVYTANPGGETFAYMHLDKIADIHEGDELQKGAPIGYVGNTGALTAPTHLHFEIRYNNVATDPFPRLTRIFPLADKIEYLKNILNNAVDQKSLAESMVILYRKEFLLAQTLNIVLPASITEAMANKTILAISSITRTLRVGSQGEDVKALQSALGITADGSFGPKTKAAVIAFQISKGLTPDGVFGPISRAALASINLKYPAGCTSSVGYSPTTGTKCVVLY